MDINSNGDQTTRGFPCEGGMEDGGAYNRPRLDPETKTWHYPSTKDVFEEVGLFSIEHYILVRRQTIAAYIVHRPIFSMCTGAGRRRGSSPRQFWWEQRMDLELARASAPADVDVPGTDE